MSNDDYHAHYGKNSKNPVIEHLDTTSRLSTIDKSKSNKVISKGVDLMMPKVCADMLRISQLCELAPGLQHHALGT